MATPTSKSPAINALLDRAFGGNRVQSINSDRCAFEAMGKCHGDGSATQFTDPLSRREYTISGMCQACQDFVFRDPDDESPDGDDDNDNEPAF